MYLRAEERYLLTDAECQVIATIDKGAPPELPVVEQKKSVENGKYSV
jgi:hypothetical protein